MSREVEFDPNDVCDGCGAKGAFDFMGDLICQACLDKPFEPCAIYNPHTDELEYISADAPHVARWVTPDFTVYFDMDDRTKVIGVRLSAAAIRKAFARSDGGAA